MPACEGGKKKPEKPKKKRESTRGKWLKELQKYIVPKKPEEVPKLNFVN